MAGLKAWDGSAFVDGEPRIWDGSAFVAPSACHVWDGSGFVKVWPTFTRQRMVKNGTQSMSGSRAIVPNWSSDSAFPSTIVGNKLVVQGGGSATIATSSLSPSGNGGGGNWSRIFLMHNGTTIATYEKNGSAGWGSPAWSIPRTVSDGDTIWVETQFDAFGAVTIVDQSYVEVIPA